MILMAEFFVTNGAVLKRRNKLIVGHEALPASVLSFAGMHAKAAAP